VSLNTGFAFSKKAEKMGSTRELLPKNTGGVDRRVYEVHNRLVISGS
jgi:hypothetical protein